MFPSPTSKAGRWVLAREVKERGQDSQERGSDVEREVKREVCCCNGSVGTGPGQRQEAELQTAATQQEQQQKGTKRRRVNQANSQGCTLWLRVLLRPQSSVRVIHTHSPLCLAPVLTNAPLPLRCDQPRPLSQPLEEPRCRRQWAAVQPDATLRRHNSIRDTP